MTELNTGQSPARLAGDLAGDGRVVPDAGVAGSARDGVGGLVLSPLPGRVGFEVRGHLELDSRERWQEELAQLVGHDADVHLDLGGVGFVSGWATAIVVVAAQRLLPDHRIVLINTPYSMRRVLEVLYPGVGGIEVMEEMAL